MYTVKIVYNSLLKNELKPLELSSILGAFIPKDHIEIYDESIGSKTRRKALQVKNNFGARLSPFVGVYIDKKIIKGFYSEDKSCNINTIIDYFKDIMKIPQDKIPLMLIDFSSRVDLLLKLKEMSKEEFLEKYPDSEDIYDSIHNSKTGYIKITKESSNPGYISEGSIKEGFTPAFGEGISCFIENDEEYYYTSTIKSIDWEEKKFHTLNSTYKFEFYESTRGESKETET